MKSNQIGEMDVGRWYAGPGKWTSVATSFPIDTSCLYDRRRSPDPNKSIKWRQAQMHRYSRCMLNDAHSTQLSVACCGRADEVDSLP